MTGQPPMQAPAKAMFLVGVHRPSNIVTYHGPACSKRGVPTGSLGHRDLRLWIAVPGGYPRQPIYLCTQARLPSNSAFVRVCGLPQLPRLGGRPLGPAGHFAAHRQANAGQLSTHFPPAASHPGVTEHEAAA